MSEQTAIQPRPETGLAKIRNTIMSAKIKERFAEMMGDDSIYYLNQVMILVVNDENLQRCSPQSILTSAMRAASLKLDLDKAKGQAWIIPYKGKAEFQLGYKGLYDMAIRTNQYRALNIVTVYEGETLIENRMTGILNLGGHKTGDRVQGYMLYFELFNGFTKTFYMTVEEIEEHAAAYAQGYKNPRSPWNDKRERPKMMKKTVLSNGLRRWGVFNNHDKEILNAIEDERQDHRVYDVDPDLVEQPTSTAPKSVDQNLSELGFGAPEPESEMLTLAEIEPIPFGEDEPGRGPDLPHSAPTMRQRLRQWPTRQP